MQRREREQERASERERVRGSPGPLGPVFIYLFIFLFPPSPGPALCKLGYPGVLFVLPEVGPSFVLLLWAFPILVIYPPPF